MDRGHQEKVFMSCDESQLRVLLEKAFADFFLDLRIVIAKLRGVSPSSSSSSSSP